MKKFLTIILIFAVAVTLVACDIGKETVNVASAASFRPYGYYEKNKLCGVDIEIAKALAKQLNMRFKVTAVPFDLLISEIESGDYDIGIAALIPTENSEKKVDFTENYVTNTQRIVVATDSTIKSVSSLFDATATKVGALTGTAGYLYATWDIADAECGTVVGYDTAEALISALKSGECDCAFMDESVAEKYTADDEGVKLLRQPYSTEAYAIAVNKSLPELKEKLNDALAALTEDGTIQAIIEKNVG